jgi:hypothetical protein
VAIVNSAAIDKDVQVDSEGFYMTILAEALPKIDL